MWNKTWSYNIVTTMYSLLRKNKQGRREMSHYIKLHLHSSEKNKPTFKYLDRTIKIGRNQSCYIWESWTNGLCRDRWDTSYPISFNLHLKHLLQLKFLLCPRSHWIKSKSKSEEWIAFAFLISSRFSLTLKLKLS